MTVAIVVLELVHLTAWLAVAGSTFAVSLMVLPATTADAPLTVTVLTGVVMLIVLLLYLPVPSVAVALMTALPALTPLTTPADVTVAIVVLELVHLTAWLAANGSILAISVTVLPTAALPAPLIATDVTGALAVTVIVCVAAAMLPSVAFAVITALPTALPVTLPAVSIVAIVGLLLDHVTVLLSALTGAAVAASVIVLPTCTAVKPLIVMETTGCVTVISLLPTISLPSVAVALIVAVPAATPVTTPLVLTVATAVFSLDQVTVFVVAPVGVIVAVSVTVLPFTTVEAPFIVIDVTFTVLLSVMLTAVILPPRFVASRPSMNILAPLAIVTFFAMIVAPSSSFTVPLTVRFLNAAAVSLLMVRTDPASTVAS